MKTYRSAVIGCGGRAPAHIDAYQHIPNAKVVACCAPSAKRREPLAARYGIHAYADPEEMIRQEQPDIVHLITWPDTRVELMSLVARLEVPLCTTEKPVAIGVPDWRKLCDLEAHSKTKFAVCHQVRWQPYLVQCRQALQSGQLGDVLLIDISAGMNLAAQGTHTLNYGMSLNGNVPVVRVFGSANGWDVATPGHPSPVTSEAYLTFANGVRALWSSGVVSPHCGDPTIVWQHVRVAAYAQKGRILYEEFGKWEIVSPEREVHGNYGGMSKWAQNNILAQAAFHQAMFDWLEDDSKAPGTNLKQGLHEWAVVLALYLSAIDRCPVEMATFNPSDDLVERFQAL